MIRRWLGTSKQMNMMIMMMKWTTQTPFSSCISQVPIMKSKRKKSVLMNSENLDSTLSKCPSDLIALSFFLWSSQRRDSLDFLAFDRMVPVVVRLTHHYKTLKTILSQLDSIGCLVTTNPKSFFLLLRIFSRAGMHTFLIQTYLLMESYGFVPNTFARNLLMDTLFKTSQPQLAFSVFKHTCSPNFFTFNIALFHLSHLNHLTHLTHDVLRLMLRMHYYPNAATFHALFNSFCNINALLQAYQLLGLMIVLGIEFDTTLWTILIHKYCKLGRLDVATNLFRNMIQTGCAPNVVTYTILIKAFVESNMVTDAFHLLNIMSSAGQIPDLIFYNVLIDCLSKVGRHQDAIQAFLSMPEQNIKPDSYTFTSLLSTVCLSKMFYLLPNLLQHSSHIETDLVFCNALLSSFIKAGLPSDALGFYNDMIHEGFEPDKYSFAGLLSALCAARRTDEAVNVYRGVLMTYHATDSHIHTVLTGELIKAGKYHMAASVFRLAVTNKYPLDNVAYTVGIHALLRSGRILEASTLYDQMKDNGLEPNVQTCNMMLFTFCKEKDHHMVEKMLNEMIDLRIELSDRNFFNLCKFPSRSESSGAVFSALNLLAEMRDLGLLSAKVLHALSFDTLPEDAIENHKHCAEVNTEWNPVLDSSSSEDMSDVAVSVG